MVEFLAERNDNNSIPRFISTISCLLQRAMDWSDAHAFTNSHNPPPTDISAFYSVSKPEISIHCYLERIFRFTHCSDSCFVVAYIYLNRFLLLHPYHTIDSLNVHRLLITSVLTAIKFMDDRHFKNAYFAKVGGISLDELNSLEVDFLFSLRFRLNVKPMNFAYYCTIFQREANAISPQIPPRLHVNRADEESRNICKMRQHIID